MKKIFLIPLLFFFSASDSAVVTNLQAQYKHGQVFLTWNNIGSTGVKYFLYKSSTPITSGAQLSSAQNLGYVVDSSGVNKRLTSALNNGSIIGFKIDSAGNQLTPGNGLFVITCIAPGIFYYAITTKIGSNEDTSIVVGSNSLASGIVEAINAPQPVWQQSCIINNRTVQVYAHFVSAITSATYPEMTNAGSFSFNFSVCATSSSLSPMMVRLHPGGSNFLKNAANQMADSSNEFRLAPDDWVPNDDINTTWFGFHELYDIYSNTHPNHSTGIYKAYTINRVMWTIDWVSKHFNIDTSRIYVTGTSTGAIGSKNLAFLFPKKFAAARLYVPRYNFNNTNELTLKSDLVNPFTGDTLTAYEAYSLEYMAHQDCQEFVPEIIAINGRNDVTTGWEEKPEVYDTMNVNRLGGIFFWDMREHTGNGYDWRAFCGPDIFQFRNNKSFPAFSNCSLSGNYGNGNPADGDSVGSMNARVGWVDEIEDEMSNYKVVLKTIDLTADNLSGFFPLADSALSGITLRRVQHFHPGIDDLIHWSNRNTAGEIIQSGEFVYHGGLITVEGIKIFKTTNTLEFSIDYFGSPQSECENELELISGTGNFVPESGEIKIYPNPASDKFYLALNGSGWKNIFIMNVSGEIVFQKNVSGEKIISVSVKPFPSGIYLLVLQSMNGDTKTERVAIVK